MFFRCKCGRNTNYGNLCVNCRNRHYGDLVIEDEEEIEYIELEKIIEELKDNDESDE